MMDGLKKKLKDKGMAFVQSERVTKILSSEQVGTVIEKAMTIPFKISSAVTAKKEKLVAMLDLATQEDIDEIRRSMAHMEDVLKNLEEKSAHPKKKTAD